MKLEQLNFDSEFFKLYQINNCYAAIEIFAADTGSNAGFIDLGDKVIVIDTFLNIDAAKDMKRAIDQYCRAEKLIVINTHFHADHVVGNSVFEGEILSTRITRESLENRFVQQVQTIQAISEKEMKEKRDRIDNETDPRKKANLENEMRFLKNLRHPEFEIRLPSTIVDENIEITGENGAVKLQVVEAHTKGDIVVKNRSAGVVYLADTLFSKCFPWIGSGTPEKWIVFCEEILQENFKYFISGHGEMGRRIDVELQKKYLVEILEIARNLRSGGKDINSIKLTDLSEGFQNWDPMVFEWNNNFLSDYLK
ncbi:MAG: MBL fold metallo-hydrolase [Candidatus Odinarchaeota archaeon]